MRWVLILFVQKKWVLAPQVELGANGIAWGTICDLPCIAQLLCRRGFSCAEEVQEFLRPRLSALRDPFEISRMEEAVTRILSAIDRRERLVLFGDYDVDGVTSLALLHHILSAYGAEPRLFLPLRMEEGYGLSAEGVERCLKEHQPQLLIAVDCGTSSLREIQRLNERRVDVVVLDHHEPKSELPECVALVNPKAHGDERFTALCSAGLAFKLAHALLKRRPVAGYDLRRDLDLVALGTVADIVPLHGENRLLVHRGSRALAATGRIGLQHLMRVAAVRPPVAADAIAFRLGPRLNAAGRLSTAEQALRLLITNDPGEAAQLAQVLDQQNRERQEVEKAVYQAAVEMLERRSAGESPPPGIVLGGEGWHPGVLGIVASRIARRYHRPTVVVGFDAEGQGKGSGRSIEGLSLVAALGTCADCLVKFGGHEMAAGLTVARHRFDEFCERFGAACAEVLSEEHLVPRLQLDHELKFCELNHDLLRWHDALQPFGSGNPQPLFLAREVEPVVEPRVINEKHLVFRLKQKGRYQRAVFFDGATEPLPPPPWDIAFRIFPDEYQGVVRLQVQLEGLRGCEASC